MKTNLIICGMLILLFSGFATTQEQAIEMWTPKTVVLYRGIDNPIAINLCGADINDLQISTNEGAIINNKDGNLSVFIPFDYKEDKLIITAEHQKAKDNLSTSTNSFKVINIPKPIISLGKLNPDFENIYSQEEVLSNLYFTYTLPDHFPYDAKYTIIKYDFFIINGEITNKYTISGDKINKTAIEFIEKAKIGEIEFLSFSNIIVKGPEGKEIKAGGLSIKFQK